MTSSGRVVIAQHDGLTLLGHPPDWQVVTRIAIEELEFWRLAAVRAAYPSVSSHIANQARWTPHPGRDAFERVMQKCGSIVQRSKNGIELLADYHRPRPPTRARRRAAVNHPLSGRARTWPLRSAGRHHLSKSP